MIARNSPLKYVWRAQNVLQSLQMFLRIQDSEIVDSTTRIYSIVEITSSKKVKHGVHYPEM